MDVLLVVFCQGNLIALENRKRRNLVVEHGKL